MTCCQLPQKIILNHPSVGTNVQGLLTVEKYNGGLWGKAFQMVFKAEM